jgi:GTP-binding protein LepA
VYSPHVFPDDGNISEVYEPWIIGTIIVPLAYSGNLTPFLFDHEATVRQIDNFGDNRASVLFDMPLRELMRNFFDELKSITSGYASISYELGEYRRADVVRLDILVGGEVMSAFSKVISRKRAEEEAKTSVEKLHKIMPRQQFETKIQAYTLGRIVASETIKAFRKDVLMHGSKMVGGGDVSRKKKLLEKQKKGKKRMREQGKVNIPQEVFLQMMRGGEN